MRKRVLLYMLNISLLAIAKTTYIPKYLAYIHIIDDADTIVASNIYRELELKERSGMFNIIVEHEDVTKVKAIKRAKRAAGWATVSAVMSGVSTAFSKNTLQYLVSSTNTQIAKQLADIYIDNARAEQTLGINIWIENTTIGELMINDMERGLTWYVRPSQFFCCLLNNPDVVNLRISDVHNKDIRYMMIAAGSQVSKREIEWEDNDCWIYGIWGNLGFSEIKVIEKYLRISKTDFTEREMSTEEFKAYKKEANKR